MKWRSVDLDPPQPFEFVWWGWLNDDESVVMGRYRPDEHGYTSCFWCEAVGEEGWFADEFGRPAPTHWLPREAPDFPTLDNIMLYPQKG
jgi:hypothetical protein